jgi:hypothetical protein
MSESLTKSGLFSTRLYHRVIDDLDALVHAVGLKAAA